MTKGWNGAATPAPAKASASKKVNGKKVANDEYFTSPSKIHSRTVFAPAAKKATSEATVVTKKVATKEEIRQGAVELFSKYNRAPRK